MLKKKKKRPLGFLSYSKVKIFLPFLFTIPFLLICSCRKQEGYVYLEKESIQYREPIDPISKLGGNSPKRAPSSGNHFLIWKVSHDSLVRSLEKNFLSVLDSHKRTCQSLHYIGISLGGQKEQEIEDYIRLYESLLKEFRQGANHRVLKRKYSSLKKRIQNRIREFQ